MATRRPGDPARCDTHATDPLAHLRLTTAAYRETGKILHELAHEAAGGRWIATGGGGYIRSGRPSAWTLYFAEMADEELSDHLPESWLETSSSRSVARFP